MKISEKCEKQQQQQSYKNKTASKKNEYNKNKLNILSFQSAERFDLTVGLNLENGLWEFRSRKLTIH